MAYPRYSRIRNLVIAGGHVILTLKRAELSSALPFIAALALISIPALLVGDYPLQLMTAKLVTYILSWFGETELSGTLIQFNGLEVAVTADCSGLNTLWALIPFVLFLSYQKQVHPIYTATLVFPIVLAVNILRVIVITILAVMGGTELAMGFLHDFSGIMVFVLALSLLSLLLNRRFISSINHYLPIILQLALGGALIFQYVSVANSSPLDRFGAYLAVPAIVILCLSISRQGLRTRPSTVNLVTLSLLLVAIYLDIGPLVNLCIIGSLLSMSGHVSHQQKMMAAIIIATLPGVTAYISTVTGLHFYIIASIIFALVLSGYALHGSLNLYRQKHSITIGIAVVIASTIIILHQLPTQIAKSTSTPYILGDWIGRDIPMTAAEYELFGAAQVTKREYSRGDSVIWLFQVATQDRRDIHPPEYCYASSGWISARTDGQTLQNLTVRRSGEERLVSYWYAHRGLLFSDRFTLIATRFASIFSETPSWQMTRVSRPSITDDGAYSDFMMLLGAPLQGKTSA